MKLFLSLLATTSATTVAADRPPLFSAVYDSNHPHNRRLHVRMVGAGNKYGATPLPIRNAAAAGANGRASVAGPCGGSGAYQAAGAPEVPVGAKVSLSLQYAAGHANDANAFTATFRCGAPTENQMDAAAAGVTTFTATQCTTTQGGTEYPVPAATGRDAKIVECTLPPKTVAELAGDGASCSLSLQDQRDWGGCVDIKYVAAAAVDPGAGGGGGGNGQVGGGGGAAAPQPVAPTPPVSQIMSTKITSIVTSGLPPQLPCCGLSTGVGTITASPGVPTNVGASTMTVSGTASGTNCDPGLNFPGNQIAAQFNNIILTGAVGDLAFQNDPTNQQQQVLIGGVPAEVSFISNVLTFTMIGDSAENPKVCDTEVIMGNGPPARGSTGNTGGTTNNNNNNNNNNNVNSNTNGVGGGLSEIAIIFIVITIVVVLGAAVVIFMKNQKAQSSQPTQRSIPTAAAVGLPAKHSGGLKRGWAEAKDAAGDTYYFNKTTGETTWEKNLVMA